MKPRSTAARHDREASPSSVPAGPASGALLAGLLAVAALLLHPRPGPAQRDDPGERLDLRPCSVGGVAGELRCGTFAVSEDRDGDGDRVIDLAVTVLEATGPDPAPAPLVYLVGGPGAAATGVDAAFENLPGLRKRRDVVLVDQRGTGDSNRLDCDLMWGGPEASFTEEFLPVERVRSCRRELAERADLTRYSTPAAADDLDELRRALGYGEVDLWGGSYGTRAALVYLRRHGEHVRSVILAGPDLSHRYGSAPMALAAERALGRLAARCREDEECGARHPDLRSEVGAVLRRLERDPAGVRVPAPDGDTVRLEIGRHEFAEGLRYLMYGSETAARIPALVERAGRGDLTRFASLLLRVRSSLARQAADGMYLSVDCAEVVPRIDSADLARADTASFLRGERARQRIRACAGWPRADLPADYRDPVGSGVPALVLAGGLDPTIPGGWARTVTRWLQNSRRVVFPGRGHELGPSSADGCMRRVVTSFLEEPAPERLDASCARDRKPLDFPSPGGG